MAKCFFMLILSLFAANASAQGTSRMTSAPQPRWTYSVGAAVGSDQLGNYTEVQLGASWYQNSWLSWHNVLFSKFGEDYDSVFGLDTSIRGELNLPAERSKFGVQFYAAPGARFATRDNAAGFIEGGVVVKLAALYVGGTVKQFYYMQDREDRFGRNLPREETQTAFILAGGGSF